MAAPATPQTIAIQRGAPHSDISAPIPVRNASSAIASTTAIASSLRRLMRTA